MLRSIWWAFAPPRLLSGQDIARKRLERKTSKSLKSARIDWAMTELSSRTGVNQERAIRELADGLGRDPGGGDCTQRCQARVRVLAGKGVQHHRGQSKSTPNYPLQLDMAGWMGCVAPTAGTASGPMWKEAAASGRMTSWVNWTSQSTATAENG